MDKYQLILKEQLALDPIKAFQETLVLTENRDEFTAALYEQSLIVSEGVKGVFSSIGKAGSKVGGSIKDLGAFTKIKDAIKKMLDIIKNFRKGGEVDPTSFKLARERGLSILKKMGNVIDMAGKNNYTNPAATLRTISDMIAEVTQIFTDFKEIYNSLKKGYESGKKANAAASSAEKEAEAILKGRLGSKNSHL